MRLVNADTVADDLKDLIKSGMYPSIIAEKFVPLVHAIQMLPRVEAEPVRRGRWLHTKDDIIISGYCSECGWVSAVGENDVAGMSYCPNCGAKMEDVE